MNDYPYLNAAIGNVLKERREKLGLSKRKLAELAQLERVYLIQLERGDKRPTLNAVFCLCKGLGMLPHEFVESVEKELEFLDKNAFG